MKETNIFDLWVTFTLVITGPAHVVRRAGRQTCPPARLRPRRHASSRIFNIAVAMSYIPSLLLMIPPVLVAITLLPIVPLLYRMQRVTDTSAVRAWWMNYHAPKIADDCTMNKDITRCVDEKSDYSGRELVDSVL